MAIHENPLLLVDGNNSLAIINEGEFKCEHITFDEVRAMLDTYPVEAVATCFSSYDLENTVFDYIGVEKKDYLRLCMTNLQVGQYAIVFKQHLRPSETQPEIMTASGAHAKKIQNVYLYCQLITRTK